jgi:hypothetical protein
LLQLLFSKQFGESPQDLLGQSSEDDDSVVSYDDEGNERRRRGRRFGNDMSEEEMNIYDGMHAEYDDLTSGYSTISSNKCDIS